MVRDLRARKDPHLAMLLLLEELTQRVGAEFATVIRTVASAAALAQTDEAKSILAAVQHLLETLASVHRALRIPEARMSIDARADLRQLCEAITQPRSRHRGITVELPDTRLQT